MSPQHGPSKRPRRLKVGYSYYADTRDWRTAPRLLPVPYLRLRGRWLLEAGFTIGQNVRVEIDGGRVTLVPAD